MFETLQNHFANIAIIAVFIALAFAFQLYKKRGIEKKKASMQNLQPIHVKEETDKEPKKTKKEEKPTDTDSQKSTQADETPQPAQHSQHIATLTKRDVPPHGKINKEDFKEFAGTRILLAEDNIINQKVILGLLAESGIEVVVANDGQEALDILKKDQDFLLILMDAHMPRVDGFEATRSIRRNRDYDHILVVALSGDTAADDIRKMKEAGMSEHLEKPLSIDALYDIIYAYTSPKKSQKSTQTPEAENLPVLDVQKGLLICGGDEAFYTEILKEFFQSYEHAGASFEKMLQQNRREEADKLLLDIIGVAANIGAEQLNNTATQLKIALKNNTREVEALSIDFYNHLKALLNKIKTQL